MLTERLEENRIYNEDCLDTLERMEDSLLDLTVTSPPYNVSLDYNTYDDNKKHDDYIEWLSEIFSMIYLKTKVGGRCVINIGDGKKRFCSDTFGHHTDDERNRMDSDDDNYMG